MSEVIYRKMTPEERGQEIERVREKAILDEASMKDFVRKETITKMVANLRNAGVSEEQIKIALNGMN